jgi:AsmA family protein
MKFKGRALVRRATAITAATLGAIALAIIFFPWNALRGPIGDYVGRQLGRTVSIGALSVNLGWITRVHVEDLSIGNALWSADERMFHVRSASAEVHPWSLLRGAPRMPVLQLTEPEVLMERSRDGAPNWLFGASQVPPDIRVGTIDVDRGVVRYRDPILRADISVKVQSVPGAGGAFSSLRFAGEGSLRREPFHIDGVGSALSALRNVEDPYQLTLHAKAGTTDVLFDGTVVPSEVENLRGNLKLQGKDLSQLYPLVPLPIPWTPPYKLSGQLAHQGARWSYRQLSGTVGDSDLRGETEIDLSRERPSVVADLSSRRFDYKDLGGVLGLPPGEGASGKTAEQQRVRARRAASDRVLPDEPFELGRLRGVDADIRFRGTSVVWADAPIDNLTTRIVLKDGLVRFAPLDFGIAGGHVVGNLSLDTNGDIARGEGDIEIRNVELARIFPKLASPKGTTGRFGGRAVIKSRGNTIASMAAVANGQAAMIMRGGEASTFALVMTNLDLARAVVLLMKGDETSEIHCAAGSFALTDGHVASQYLVIDTTAETIYGAGGIDFRDETYDLRLSANSKKASILALRGPIVVGGTFKTPLIHPETGAVTTRVGAAAGLAAVAPPLALLALIDPGGAPDVDCAALLADTKMPSSASISTRVPSTGPSLASRGH